MLPFTSDYFSFIRSSCLLSEKQKKNIKLKFSESLFNLFWSHSKGRTNSKLRVFEDRLLRKIYRFKREEVTEGWRI
jgi:hypothetical protein